MSEVYLSVDNKLKLKWVVKKIKQDPDKVLIETAYAEINALRRLRIDRVARIADVFRDDEAIYIVTEYIEGMNLKQYLENNKHIAALQRLKWARDIAETLKTLHDRRPPIIYRDLKPENIIVRKDNELCLIDFGAAKLSKSKKDRIPFGTRGFAAPEQYQSLSDKRSDIYAYGQTLESLKAKDPLIRPIIDKCTKSDPDKRFQSVDPIIRFLNLYISIWNYRYLALLSAILICLFLPILSTGHQSQKDLSTIEALAAASQNETHYSASKSEEELFQTALRTVIKDGYPAASSAIKELARDFKNAPSKEKEKLFLVQGRLYITFESILTNAKEIENILLDEIKNMQIDTLSENSAVSGGILTHIYRHLGIRNPKDRSAYYKKAIEYAEASISKNQAGSPEERQSLLYCLSEMYSELGVSENALLAAQGPGSGAALPALSELTKQVQTSVSPNEKDLNSEITDSSISISSDGILDDFNDEGAMKIEKRSWDGQIIEEKSFPPGICIIDEEGSYKALYKVWDENGELQEKARYFTIDKSPPLILEDELSRLSLKEIKNSSLKDYIRDYTKTKDEFYINGIFLGLGIDEALPGYVYVLKIVSRDVFGNTACSILIPESSRGENHPLLDYAMRTSGR
ncbi:MAG: serine/threonine protein kinase [Lachnospiraceae bacterium]|nr:serine/threonine protein kinase [Lachnospiraceae bacterium]